MEGEEDPFSKICSTCFATHVKTDNLFGSSIYNHLKETLIMSTPEIDEEITSPLYVCKNCQFILSSFYNFRQNSIKNITILESIKRVGQPGFQINRLIESQSKTILKNENESNLKTECKSEHLKEEQRQTHNSPSRRSLRREKRSFIKNGCSDLPSTQMTVSEPLSKMRICDVRTCLSPSKDESNNEVIIDLTDDCDNEINSSANNIIKQDNLDFITQMSVADCVTNQNCNTILGSPLIKFDNQPVLSMPHIKTEEPNDEKPELNQYHISDTDSNFDSYSQYMDDNERNYNVSDDEYVIVKRDDDGITVISAEESKAMKPENFVDFLIDEIKPIDGEVESTDNKTILDLANTNERTDPIQVETKRFVLAIQNLYGKNGCNVVVSKIPARKDGGWKILDKPLNIKGRFFKKRLNNLPAEINTISSLTGFHKCSKCKETFSSLIKFRKHIVLVHKKPFKCLKCGRKFQQSITYSVHLLSHANIVSKLVFQEIDVKQLPHKRFSSNVENQNNKNKSLVHKENCGEIKGAKLDKKLREKRFSRKVNQRSRDKTKSVMREGRKRTLLDSNKKTQMNRTRKMVQKGKILPEEQFGKSLKSNIRNDTIESNSLSTEQDTIVVFNENVKSSVTHSKSSPSQEETKELLSKAIKLLNKTQNQNVNEIKSDSVEKVDKDNEMGEQNSLITEKLKINIMKLVSKNSKSRRHDIQKRGIELIKQTEQLLKELKHYKEIDKGKCRNEGTKRKRSSEKSCSEEKNGKLKCVDTSENANQFFGENTQSLNSSNEMSKISTENDLIQIENILISSRNFLLGNKNVTLSDNLSVPSENLSVRSENLSLPSENLSVPNENLSVPNENLSVPSANLSVPSENLSVPSENLSVPSENLSGANKNLLVPNEMLSVLNKDVSVINKNVPVSVSVPNTNLIVQKQILPGPKNSSELNKSEPFAIKNVLVGNKNILVLSKNLPESSKNLQLPITNLLSRNVNLSVIIKKLSDKSVAKVNFSLQGESLSGGKNSFLSNINLSEENKNLLVLGKNLSVPKEKLLVLNQDVSVQNKDLSVVNKDVSVFNEDVTVLNKDLSVQNKDLSVLSKDLSVQNKDVSVLSKDLSVQNKDVSVLSKDLSVQNKDMSVLNKDVAVLNKDVLVLNKDLSVLNKDKKTSSVPNKKPEKNLAVPEKKLTILNRNLPTPNIHSGLPIKGFSVSNKNLSGPMEKLSKPIEDVPAPIENIPVAIEDSSEPTEYLSEPIENSSESIENLSVPIGDLSGSSEELSMLFEDFSKSSQNLSVPTEDLSTTIEDLSKTIEELSNENISAQQKKPILHFCDLCEKQVDTLYRLTTSEKLYNYICLNCRTNYLSSTENVKEASVPMVYPCEACNKLFIQETSFLLHIEKHDRKRKITKNYLEQEEKLSVPNASLGLSAENLSESNKNVLVTRRKSVPKTYVSGRKKTLSETNKQLSPQQRNSSPEKRNLSPQKLNLSPQKRNLSPQKRKLSETTENLLITQKNVSIETANSQLSNENLSRESNLSVPHKKLPIIKSNVLIKSKNLSPNQSLSPNNNLSPKQSLSSNKNISSSKNVTSNPNLSLPNGNRTVTNNLFSSKENKNVNFLKQNLSMINEDLVVPKEKSVKNQNSSVENQNLSVENKNLLVENQSLLVENQNVSGQDQNFLKENQNLPVDNQYLLAENQNLSVEEQILLVEDQNSSVENQNLFVENQNLSVENQNLSVENNVSVENQNLSVKNQNLSEENQNLLARNKNLPVNFCVSELKQLSIRTKIIICYCCKKHFSSYDNYLIHKNHYKYNCYKCHVHFESSHTYYVHKKQCNSEVNEFSDSVLNELNDVVLHEEKSQTEFLKNVNLQKETGEAKDKMENETNMAKPETKDDQCEVSSSLDHSETLKKPNLHDNVTKLPHTHKSGIKRLKEFEKNRKTLNIFTCKICDREFSREEGLERHTISHLRSTECNKYKSDFFSTKKTRSKSMSSSTRKS